MSEELRTEGIPGLDLTAFRRWYDAERPDEITGELRGRVIAGGRSNLTYEVTDGTASVAAQQSFNLAAVNDAPVLDLNGAGDGTSTALTYTENAGATPIAANATVADVDSSNFDGGILNIGFNVADPQGQLGIRHQGDSAGEIGVSGASVTYGGIEIGTLSGGVLPDLRYSDALKDDSFFDIVLGGALKANGMASWSAVLDKPQATQIRDYLIAQAHARQAELAKAGK